MKSFDFLNTGSIKSNYDADNGCIVIEDGTLICYGKTDKYVELAQSGYGDYRAILLKPFGDFYSTVIVDGVEKKYTFVTPPIVLVDQASSDDYMYGSVIGVIRTTERIESVTISRSVQENGWVTPHYIAIGRWK